MDEAYTLVDNTWTGYDSDEEKMDWIEEVHTDFLSSWIARMTPETHAPFVTHAKRGIEKATAKARADASMSLAQTYAKIVEEEDRLDAQLAKVAEEETAYCDMVRFVLGDTQRTLDDVVETYTSAMGGLDVGIAAYYDYTKTGESHARTLWDGDNESNFRKRAESEQGGILYAQMKDFVETFGRPAKDDATVGTDEQIAGLQFLKLAYDAWMQTFNTRPVRTSYETDEPHPMISLSENTSGVWSSPGLALAAVDVSLSEFYIYNITQGQHVVEHAEQMVVRISKNIADLSASVSSFDIEGVVAKDYDLSERKRQLKRTLVDAAEIAHRHSHRPVHGHAASG
jgi:hypothetical protein